MTAPTSMQEADQRGGCVRTASGRYVSVTSPQPQDIILGDVAHHLSQINRYTGAARHPFSVAQHSVLVSYLLPPSYAFDGLWHDFPEYIVQDVNSPLKKQAFMTGYRENEGGIHAVGARVFGFEHPIPYIVHVADMHAGALERYVLFDEALPPNLVPCWMAHNKLLLELQWWQARDMFLDRFHQLSKGTVAL